MSFSNEDDAECYVLNLPCLLEIHASLRTKMIKGERMFLKEDSQIQDRRGPNKDISK